MGWSRLRNKKLDSEFSEAFVGGGEGVDKVFVWFRLATLLKSFFRVFIDYCLRPSQGKSDTE